MTNKEIFDNWLEWRPNSLNLFKSNPKWARAECMNLKLKENSDYILRNNTIRFKHSDYLANFKLIYVDK